MRRPTALRRLGARVFDRRMAAGAFSLVAVVVLCAAAVARAPDSGPAVAKNDPAAARDLVALMRAGEAGSWLARYEFTRTLADGRSLRQPLTEARDGARHVLVSGNAMSVERDGRAYECNLVNEEAACHATPESGAVAASEVIRIAVDAGAYAVSRQAPTTIAGVAARCFRVSATGRGQLPAIGTETDLCLSAAGAPLSQRVVRTTGDVDERLAGSVDEGVSSRAVDAVERDFGPKAASGRP